MGTTITMAYVVWPQVYLIHVGDSRAYLFRDGTIARLTHDQTYAQALVESGVMAEADIRKSPLRHVLSGLLGCDPQQLTPQISQLKLALNDKLLLCTYGLTLHLNESEISAQLVANKSSQAICAALIADTNKAGGRDNTTLVLAQFTDGTVPLQAMAAGQEESTTPPATMFETTEADSSLLSSGVAEISPA